MSSYHIVRNTFVGKGRGTAAVNYNLSYQPLPIYSVKYHLKKLTAKSLADVSGQRSTSRVQAHMERLSFVSACFIEQPFGAYSRLFLVFIPSGGILLPSSAVFERFGVVFFSLPPPTLPSMIQSVLTGAWNGGSWLGCGDLPAMGIIFYLGAGSQQWKPLDTLGNHLPFK